VLQPTGMVTSAIAPDRITPLAGTAATTVTWRSRGQIHATVIAKATFAFASEAEMPRTEPQEILRGEVHHGKNPGRSVRFTSDLAPYLGLADVLFTGHAYAPPGATVQSLPVRLTITDGNRVVLDKGLLVQDSAGFQRMPVVYERAVRGVNATENPLGVDAEGGPSAANAANVVDPVEPLRPAGFGPIARAWPARKRLLGDTPRKALDEPIIEIPEAFDWSYFQAAPPDQRVGYLRGGEWLALQGLHPTQPLLRMRLPEARGGARVYGLSTFGVSEGHPLALHADTLRIDGDGQRCTVVFRASFPVPDESALAAVRLVVGVDVPGTPLAWPAPPGVEEAVEATAPARKGAGPATDTVDPVRQARLAAAASTMMLSEQTSEAAAHPWSATPFRPASGAEGHAARGAGAEAPRAQAPRVDTGTLALSGDDEEEDASGWRSPAVGAPRASASDTMTLLPEHDTTAQEHAALPFQPALPGAALSLPRNPREPSPSRDELAGSGTLALSSAHEELPDEKVALPFSASPPAAPAEALARAPTFELDEDTFAADFTPTQEDIPGAPTVQPATASAIAPATASAPAPALDASPPASPWAAEAPAPRPPPPPPPPPALLVPPTPSPALRRSLYERFDRKR
jgi:hypothetical protein